MAPATNTEKKSSIDKPHQLKPAITAPVLLAASLLIANAWAFDTDKNSTIGTESNNANLTVHGELEINSVGDSNGVVTSTEKIASYNDDTKLATTQAIKSYVDAKVAAAGNAYPTEASQEASSSEITFAAAASYCRDLDDNGDGWRLPTAGELANLCVGTGTNCNDTQYYWTVTHRDAVGGYWVRLRPEDGYWATGDSTSGYYVRCVR